MLRWGPVLVLASAAFAAVPASASAGDGSAGAAVRARKRRPKTTPLVLQKFTPRHGAKFVDLGADIRLRFSAPVDPATVTPQNILVRRLLETETVEWTPRLTSGGRTVVLSLAAPFEPGTDYEVVVLPGVAKPDGTSIKRRKHAIFYTDNRFSPYPVLHPDMFMDLLETMHEPRAAHSATVVAGGYVLIAGGQTDTIGMCVSAELYDPYLQDFRLLQTLLGTPRAYHPAVRLNGGDALLIGGWDGNGGAIATTEVYDRSTASLRSGGTMNEDRDFHAAVTLRDGRVLVTGGLHYLSTGAAYSETAELMDLDRVWHVTAGKPLRRRVGHTLSLLPDGTVLIVGGTTESQGFGTSAEIFDPKTETFRFVTGSPRQHRQLHSAVTIDVGEGLEPHVLLADGGDPIAEVYDPLTERFYPAGGSSFSNRTRATSSLLPSGDVLFAGGFEQRGTTTLILSSMDLYVRSAGDWGRIFYVNVAFKQPRAGHTASTLLDGSVLFAGGFDQAGGTNLDTAVVFTPPPAPAAKTVVPK